MFNQTEFVCSAPTLDFLPVADRGEVTFAGRSNVGKSSLINALTNRKDLARTSNTPGRTQALNFFTVDDAFYLVDIPGYGYARASKKAISEWNKTMRGYLFGRPTLRRVFLLIDSRHGVKEIDEEMMAKFDEAAVSYQIVLTKADKIKAPEREACLAQTQAIVAKHGAAHPEILVTSAEKGMGMDSLRREIMAVVKG